MKVFNKTQVVYGTGKGQLKKDKAYDVHSIVAEKLIKSGAATKEKAKETKPKETK